MKSIFVSILIVALIATACKKNETTNTVTPQIAGHWVFSSRYLTDSLSTPLDTSFHYYLSDLTSMRDPYFLNFTAAGKLYAYENGWGPGQSGVIYSDTADYSIKGNTVIIRYPAGAKYFDIGYQAYPGYQDTLTIQSVTATQLCVSRNYHHKYYNFYSGETKFSVDTLVR